jgi:Leucine-rich repeat (LRR) protein
MKPKYGLFLLLFVISITCTKQQDCVFIGCECDNKENVESGGLIDCEKLKDFPKRNEDYEQKQFESLIISSNEINEIPDERFDGLSIEDIRLDDNHIYKISKNAFKGLLNVIKLDLSSNCIGCARDELKANYGNNDASIEVSTTDFIDSTILDPLGSSLRELRLNENQLHKITLVDLNRLFENLHQLETLDLFKNSLKFMPNLQNLKRLKTLTLSSNKILTLNDALNQNLLPASLVSLDMEKNSIASIESNWFSHLTELTSLKLKGNLISAIAENAFSNLKKLEILDLSSNYIKHIPSKCFLTLGSLKSLDLSLQEFAIEAIGDYAFDRELIKNQNNKLSIKLSGNKISKISNKAFCTRNAQNSGFIHEIKLDGNPLVQVDPCVLKQLSGSQDDIKSRNSIYLPSLPCSCDVTYLAKMFNLHDGECKNERSTAVKMHEFYCLTYDEYVKTKDVECKSEIYDCLAGRVSAQPDNNSVLKTDDPVVVDEKVSKSPGQNDNAKQDILTTLKPKAISFASRPSNNFVAIVLSIFIILLIK